jgi:hypothetical protein
MDEIASLLPLLQVADPKERVQAIRALEKLAMPGRTPDPPKRFGAGSEPTIGPLSGEQGNECLPLQPRDDRTVSSRRG